MVSPLRGRLKRLEGEARVGVRRAYALLPEASESTAEWLELHVQRDKNQVEELKPLQRNSCVRRTKTRVRTGSLLDSVAEYRQRPAIGREPAEIWVCSDHQIAHDLIGELAKADAFSHAFVFTDLENEMLLGPSRYRIDQ
jgi:hypothetical protein